MLEGVASNPGFFTTHTSVLLMSVSSSPRPLTQPFSGICQG
jgi:hypothetical protein